MTNHACYGSVLASYGGMCMSLFSVRVLGPFGLVEYTQPPFLDPHRGYLLVVSGLACKPPKDFRKRLFPVHLTIDFRSLFLALCAI